MRILYYDIDTLRPDHLGCYGYLRNTSPNVDRIAAEGVRFEKCYVSDAPCLPSRASMFTGQFGIHTGIVGHGGTAADIRPRGCERQFNTVHQWPGFIECLRARGIYPVSVSPYAERHSAWWFEAGWREFYNPGKCGGETADEIVPIALDWLKRNGKKDDWMLHINVWDPHTPYRTPKEFGDPFADEPIDPWYTEELRLRQWNGFGASSPQEPGGGTGPRHASPRQPARVASMDDYKKFIDGYDCGIRYADEWFGRVLNALDDAGVLEDTVIIITADHGENLGELGVISDHQTADRSTCRVPLIIRWPGMGGQRVDDALHYQTDIAATVVQMLGGEVPAHWDGRGFAEAFKAGRSEGRDSVVFSQNAWSCMRSVRWGDYLFARTYHTGLKDLPAKMLFNVADDPHELNDLAQAQPQLADHGQALIESWTGDMLSRSEYIVDPMWLVMHEGGPYHSRGRLEAYCRHLRQTDRGRHADFLEAHPTGIAT